MTGICTTTDFCDDIFRAGRHFEKRDLDDLMKYSASLGSTRHEWILDTIWTLYDEDAPQGFDLLAEACDAAHRHGMRFDVVYKPFEGALRGAFPHDAPRPTGAPLLDEIFGLAHAVRPFVAEHPEMRLARRPDDEADPGGRIAAVRLVKSDDAPAPFGPADISLLASARNGGHRPCEGPVSFTETVEWRPIFPYSDQPCRVLTLGGLKLSPDTRFLLVRCARRAGPGRFANEIEQLVELVNEQGKVIPSSPSLRRLDPVKVYEGAERIARLAMTRYARCPEVRAFLADRDAFLASCREMHTFSAGWEKTALDETGEVAVARGKPRHVVGRLNPVYPEVRAHWLADIRFCVARGVDGVNIRIADHNRPLEPWAFGFNEPTLERMEHRENTAEAARVNGEAYTIFLREAAGFLHDNGREIGIHLHKQFLRHDDIAANNDPLPRNMDFAWQTWVREIADYVELRGTAQIRPENVREVTDRFGYAARQAGIPFVYQCARGGPVHFAGPHHALAREMKWARNHPDIAFYNLYETANYSRFNAEGRFEGSPDLAALVRRCLGGAA